MTLEISIQNNHFILHCSGAMYWSERKILLISDVHLGKVSHFQKHGAAIPGAIIEKNFSKLDLVVELFQPEEVLFLGDLFHSSLNSEWHIFKEWVEKTAIPTFLVAGNHDVINPKLYAQLHIQVIKQLIVDDFLFTHHPEDREGFFTICGHVHPAVRLIGKGRQSLKLPCFFQSDNQLIIPAFGEFTGTYILQPQEGNKVFVITKDAVVQVFG